jgi:hypothetical protein
MCVLKYTSVTPTESVSYFGIGHSSVLAREEPSRYDVLPYSVGEVAQAGFPLVCVFRPLSIVFRFNL